MRTLWVSSLVMMTALVLQAERQPFDRYQPIIDRQMFGTLPEDFDPEKMPSEVARSSSRGEAELTKEQEQIKSSIRFSSINITPTGETAVGFTDNSDPKVPRHYYLKVGEKRNGWELKEADAVKATMTIAKGDVTVSLALGGDSSKAADATSRRSNSSSLRRGPGVGPKSGSSAGTPFERLRGKRKLEMEGMFKKFQAENEARERERAEEQAKHDEERENMRKELLELKESLQQKAKAAEEEKTGSDDSGNSSTEE